MKIRKALKRLFSELKIIDNIEINQIKMDSRAVKKDDVFFAIGGGNNFIKQVLEKGASLVICDKNSDNIVDERILVVKDTIKAMQELAKEYRALLDIDVIAITGTSGKTSTKDMTYTILSKKYKGIKTEGNFNNHIGLPYTILQLKESDQFAVLEMGMSNFGEIDFLCQIAKPNYGIITNIGESHLEFLGTLENVYKAKSEMLKYLDKDKVILWGDDKFLSKSEGIKIGKETTNQILLEQIEESENGVKFVLDGEDYSIPIPGEYNAYNASLAIKLGIEKKVELSKIREALDELVLSSMRYEKIQVKNYLFINDAYNAEPLSVKSVISSYSKLYNDTYKVIVLGDMLELGEKSKEYHLEIGKALKNVKIDMILLYGQEMKSIAESNDCGQNILHFESKKEIKKEIQKIKNKATILLKGSRGMKLEEIIITEGE